MIVFKKRGTNVSGVFGLILNFSSMVWVFMTFQVIKFRF